MLKCIKRCYANNLKKFVDICNRYDDFMRILQPELTTVSIDEINEVISDIEGCETGIIPNDMTTVLTVLQSILMTWWIRFWIGFGVITGKITD